MSMCDFVYVRGHMRGKECKRPARDEGDGTYRCSIHTHQKLISMHSERYHKALRRRLERIVKAAAKFDPHKAKDTKNAMELLLESSRTYWPLIQGDKDFHNVD